MELVDWIDHAPARNGTTRQGVPEKRGFKTFARRHPLEAVDEINNKIDRGAGCKGPHKQAKAAQLDQAHKGGRGRHDQPGRPAPDVEPIVPNKLRLPARGFSGLQQIEREEGFARA